MTSMGARSLRYGERALNGYLKLEPKRSHYFQHGGEFRDHPRSRAPCRGSLDQDPQVEPSVTCPWRGQHRPKPRSPSLGRRLRTRLPNKERYPCRFSKRPQNPKGIVLIFGLGLVLLMPVLLKVARKFDRHRDIMVLRSLVTAGDEYYQPFASTDEGNAVAGTVVDPHLRDATSDRLRVAGIADRKSTNWGIDAGPRSTIA